jgi:histidyl-tRNA synthetase
VLVTVFGDETRGASVHAARVLREAGVSTELFLGSTSSRKSFKKQMKYANVGGYPWVVVIGPDEAADGVATLKNMRTGEQERIGVSLLASKVR